MNLKSFKQFLEEARLPQGQRAYVSHHPNWTGTTVDEKDGPLDTPRNIKIKNITGVTEPDEQHITKPGAREKIDSMVQHVKSGKSLPPVKVKQTSDGKYTILDGHHRFAAAKIAGKKN